MAEVVHDHEEDVKEVGPQNVLRPMVVDDIRPAPPGITEDVFHLMYTSYKLATSAAATKKTRAVR